MFEERLSRRSAVLLAITATLGKASTGRGQTPSVLQPDWLAAPIGWPDRVPGDGFRIGHGFASENTWFAAGWWHTGEDWYAVDDDTAGASVYAVAAGQVVYADFSYPGRVVIVQHADDLFSMYGHLEPSSVPAVGSLVAAGDQVGIVFPQGAVKGPGQAPSHLHFEVRNFFIRDEVNGNNPLYNVNCGFQCPPGPGYQPMSAPTHPVDLGWLNPTEAMFERVDIGKVRVARLVANSATSDVVPLHSEPTAGSEVIAVVAIDGITSGGELAVGDLAAPETSAEGYDVWLRVATDEELTGWVQLAVPSFSETGSDGRPSSVDRPVLFAPR